MFPQNWNTDVINTQKLLSFVLSPNQGTEVNTLVWGYAEKDFYEVNLPFSFKEMLPKIAINCSVFLMNTAVSTLGLVVKLFLMKVFNFPVQLADDLWSATLE